ncbi:MAG: phosphoenolpyruvate carboxykinase (ATP), partial [Alphaproteobacteria bacterium]
MDQVGTVISAHGLEHHGLANLARAHWNLGVPSLYEEAIRRGEGVLAQGGPLVVRTGEHTGRAPNDKFIVEDAVSRDNIDWGKVNRPIDEQRFDALLARVLAYFQNKEVFVKDSFAGADPEFRLPVRVVTETAWHNLFAHNMFLAPSPDELAHFEPSFTILHAPFFQATPERDGTNSEVFVFVSFARRMVIIGGTIYAGEI